MTKEKYQKEIELIKAQNNTEIELYLLATEIIQPMTGELSKRYVFNRILFYLWRNCSYAICKKIEKR